MQLFWLLSDCDVMDPSRPNLPLVALFLLQGTLHRLILVYIYTSAHVVAGGIIFYP